jgi:glycosyltransferase involved in cell wall biosynthesis
MGLVISAVQVFAFFCWALALAWLWKGITALLGMPSLPDLSRMDLDTLPSIPSTRGGPSLTVVVPARDEEASIETCLRSLLTSTGLRLQIIAVDDRSSDRTGERMDAITAEVRASKTAHQFEVIHIKDLPQGWLGKPHALALGAQHAVAPWILFTDGDVVFAPRALELALREAESLKADHLVLVPTLIFRSPGERAVLAAMQALALWGVRLWKVADPRARDAMGAGGFNMIRTSVYGQIGGFEAMRMEVLEDLFLGARVKRAGFAQRAIVGAGLVNVRWIDGTFAVVRLLEKNGFAVLRFRTALLLLACFAFCVDALLPLAALAHGGWTTVAGVATYCGIALAYHASRRVTGVPAWYAVTFAPAALIVAYSFVRSMVLTLVRKGVVWRGTLYPLDELRRAARES